MSEFWEVFGRKTPQQKPNTVGYIVPNERR
jgi:hypothetical protein